MKSCNSLLAIKIGDCIVKAHAGNRTQDSSPDSGSMETLEIIDLTQKCDKFKTSFQKQHVRKSHHKSVTFEQIEVLKVVEVSLKTAE